MSSRLKILACGQVERIGNILDETQVQILDIVTQKCYNVFCHLVGEPDDGDTYEIKVCRVDYRDDILDICRMDSSGGVLKGDEFSYKYIDDELGSEIIDFMLNHFIVPF